SVLQVAVPSRRSQDSPSPCHLVVQQVTLLAARWSICFESRTGGSMSKRDKQRHPERRGVGLSSLRPRLDQLLRDEHLAELSADALNEKLDRLIEGIKPPVSLPIIISAAMHAPESAQAYLDELLPDWLSRRGHLAMLGDLVAREALDDQQQQRAFVWLAAAGADTGDLVAEIEGWNPFYAAFSAGDDMQA